MMKISACMVFIQQNRIWQKHQSTTSPNANVAIFITAVEDFIISHHFFLLVGGGYLIS